MKARRHVEHIAFHMQLAWDRYVRSFVLSSAAGLASDSRGPIAASVPSDCRSKEAAVYVLLKTYKKRTMEPDWYKPAEAIDAAQRLAINNFGSFVGPMGSTPWLLDELRWTRNFFAHRSKPSALAVRAMPWFPQGHTIKVENTVLAFHAGGIRKIEAWGEFIKTIAWAML